MPTKEQVPKEISQDEEFEPISMLSNQIRKGETPDEWILDPDTWLEHTLSQVSLHSLILGAFILFFRLIPSDSEEGLSSVFWGLGLMALGLFSYYLRKLLDDHYIVNMKTEEIHFVRSFAGSTSKQLVHRFDDLAALLLNCRERDMSSGSGKGRVRRRRDIRWEYALKIVPRKGRPITVIHYQESSHYRFSGAGEILAKDLGIPLLACPPKRRVKLVWGAQGPDIKPSFFNSGTASAKAWPVYVCLFAIYYFWHKASSAGGG